FLWNCNRSANDCFICIQDIRRRANDAWRTRRICGLQTESQVSIHSLYMVSSNKQMEERPKIKLPLSTADIFLELLNWLTFLALWGITIYTYSSLPDTIPIHFNA